MRARASAVLLAAATLALLAGPARAAEPKPTLEDCKAALLSLNEKPHSTSLPSMAAATGEDRMDRVGLLGLGGVWIGDRLTLARTTASYTTTHLLI
jgi:hypothetical protein